MVFYVLINNSFGLKEDVLSFSQLHVETADVTPAASALTNNHHPMLVMLSYEMLHKYFCSNYPDIR